MVLTIILLIIIATYYITLWLLRFFKCKPSRAPPKYPGYLPIIGHAILFLGDTIHIWSLLKDIAHRSLDNGGVATINLGPWTLHMLTDPEDCYKVGSNCLHKDGIYDIAKPWLGEGLVTAPVHTWKRHRKLVNPAFNQHVLDDYLSVFNGQSKRLVESLEAEVGKTFDHSPYLERTALEIICTMGIDKDESILNNTAYMNAVSEMFHSLVERGQTVWMQSETLFNWSALKRKQDKLVAVLHGMSNRIIQKRKTAFLNKEHTSSSENTEKRFKSFLDLLLESSVDGSLSDEEIREEVDTMISAGFDTSATLMTFAFVVIGSYPEVQEKICEELAGVFEGSDREVDKYDLPKLVYLEAVIKECLRFYPVVPLTARYLDKDVELKNFTLSAGSTCFFLVHGIHRHSIWGPDATEFRPDRWLSSDLPVNAFAAFGLGKRTCIGQKFALMSSKTTLSYILRRYRLSADHKNLVLKMDIMLKPDSGNFIKIEKREKIF